MFRFHLNFRFLCVAVLFCLPYESSFAQIDLEFSDGVSTNTTFNVPVGSSATISVTATEGPATTTLSTVGLSSQGFGLSTSGTSADTTSFQPSSAFSFTFTNTVGAGSNSEEVSAQSFSPPTGTSVLLGDLNIDVTGAGPTTFTFEDRGVGSDFSNTDGDLDAVIFEGGRTISFTINGISAIPEPSGGVLIGLSILASIMRRKRNRS